MQILNFLRQYSLAISLNNPAFYVPNNKIYRNISKIFFHFGFFNHVICQDWKIKILPKFTKFHNHSIYRLTSFLRKRKTRKFYKCNKYIVSQHSLLVLCFYKTLQISSNSKIKRLVIFSRFFSKKQLTTKCKYFAFMN